MELRSARSNLTHWHTHARDLESRDDSQRWRSFPRSRLEFVSAPRPRCQLRNATAAAGLGSGQC